MGSVLHLKKIGFKHAVHMHLFTVNHLFYMQRGSVTLNLLKKYCYRQKHLHCTLLSNGCLHKTYRHIILIILDAKTGILLFMSQTL